MMVAVLSATNLGHPDTALGPSSDRGRASASAERAEPARAQDMASQCIEDLMEAYVDGDSSAFDELYRQTAPRLMGYLIRLTRHRERAEDLVQITFSKVHRARGSYFRGAPLLPWMLAIARRSFLDEVRSAKYRRERLSADGSLPEPAPEDEPGVPAGVSEALERALEKLPDNYREAIVLTKVTGLSIKEAAEVLGVTPTAVKLRVHRGYKALRVALEQFEGGTP